MKKLLEQSSLVECAGIAAASILGAIVTVAFAIAFNVQPVETDPAVGQSTPTTYV